MAQTKKNSKKIYLKTLANEHDLHIDTYVSIMEQYDFFLFEKFNIHVKALKRNPLLPWQVDLLRRLNPTEFQIETMKEISEYKEWQEWLSNVMKICKSKPLSSVSEAQVHRSLIAELEE